MAAALAGRPTSFGLDPTGLADAAAPADGNEDDDYSELGEYESESDGELDWDPDRERLLRTLRKTGGGDYSTGRSKSLAEKRNEWRASRGLARQKTVQEIIAERRAAKEAQAPGGSSVPAARPSPLAPPSERPLEPFSADRALELGSGAAERAATLQGSKAAGAEARTGGEPVAAPEDISDPKGGRPKSGRRRGGWPWRTR